MYFIHTNLYRTFSIGFMGASKFPGTIAGTRNSMKNGTFATVGLTDECYAQAIFTAIDMRVQGDRLGRYGGSLLIQNRSRMRKPASKSRISLCRKGFLIKL